MGTVLAGRTVTANLDEDEVFFCHIEMRDRARAETAGATRTRTRAAGAADHRDGHLINAAGHDEKLLVSDKGKGLTPCHIILLFSTPVAAVGKTASASET
jgi:hypothetical protein